MSRLSAALVVIDHCHGQHALAGLIEQFYEAAKQFGFSSAANGAWYYADGQRLNRFFFNSWPPDWVELYEREGLGPMDPVVTDAARSMQCFTFSERREAWLAHAGSRKVVELAESYGWSEVFVVPVHGPFGYQGAVTLASMAKPPLDTTDRMALEAMSRAIHLRCRTEPGFGVGLEPRSELTMRQIECLRWVGAGKSDGDIALLLGLAEATVHYHVEQAKKRLGVHSRLQAVARLLLDGTL